MGEKRKKSVAVLLKIQGNASCSLELFPAEAWPDDPAAEPGNFRIRRDGRWIKSGGDFLSPSGVGALVASIIKNGLGLPSDQAAPPAIPANSRVRIHYGRVVGGVYLDSCTTRTETEPLQLMDGRWYVMVHIPGVSLSLIPCDDVDLL